MYVKEPLSSLLRGLYLSPFLWHFCSFCSMGPNKNLYSKSDHLDSSGKLHQCLNTEKAQATEKLALTAIHFKIIQTLNDPKCINLINIYWASTWYRCLVQRKEQKVQRKEHMLIPLQTVIFSWNGGCVELSYSKPTQVETEL